VLLVQLYFALFEVDPILIVQICISCHETKKQSIFSLDSLSSIAITE
jgi:hypothetical protein